MSDKLEDGIETCSKDAEVISQIGDRFVPNSFSDAGATQQVFTDMRTRYERSWRSKKQRLNRRHDGRHEEG